MFTTLLIFIAVLGVLILAHELGHFIVAKICGMYVEEFGFGFPPRLFKIKIGETIYSINLFPIGGFVKIYGEEHKECEDNDPKNDDETCPVLQTKNKKKLYEFPIWKRFLTIVAGVSMNFVLAWVLFSIVLGLGFPQEITAENEKIAQDKKVVILQAMEDSPAEKAGLEIGDEILKFANLEIQTVLEFQDLSKLNAGKETQIIIKRGDDILGFSLTPRENPPENDGPVGIALAHVGTVKYPIHQVVYKSLEETILTTELILRAFGDLLSGLIFHGKVSEGLSGPIGVAVFTKKVANVGFLALMQFTALISINLAIVNLLPIPALDGGQILFLLIEKILGKKHNHRTAAFIHKIGFVVLICLMVLVTFRDIVRFDVIGKIVGWL